MLIKGPAHQALIRMQCRGWYRIAAASARPTAALSDHPVSSPPTLQEPRAARSCPRHRECHGLHRGGCNPAAITLPGAAHGSTSPAVTLSQPCGASPPVLARPSSACGRLRVRRGGSHSSSTAPTRQSGTPACCCSSACLPPRLVDVARTLASRLHSSSPWSCRRRLSMLGPVPGPRPRPPTGRYLPQHGHRRLLPSVTSPSCPARP
jgi:hypothetical protein